MSGIGLAMAGGVSPQITNPFTAWSVVYSGTAALNVAISRLIFNSDGSVISNGQTLGGGTIQGSANWYSPITGGIGASYWIRATSIVGDPLALGPLTFTSLATSQIFSQSASKNVIRSTTFTIQIATDAAGTNVVFTSAGNYLEADGYSIV